MIMDLDDDDQDGLSNKHKVQFRETDDRFNHDSHIAIHYINEATINVSVGFLQFKDHLHCGPLAVRQNDPPNLNVHVLELNQIKSSKDMDCETSNEFHITIQLFAYKEKLLKEMVKLQSCGNNLKTLTIVLNARVLGKGKGTPLLKNGIKCIGIENDEASDSEASDWQGFE